MAMQYLEKAHKELYIVTKRFHTSEFMKLIIAKQVS